MWGSWNTVWTGKPDGNMLQIRTRNKLPKVQKSEVHLLKQQKWKTLGKKKWIGGSGQFKAKGVIPTTGKYVQTVESIQKKTGKQLKVKIVWETKSLENSSSTELATYMRSRNVEARAYRFKSFTRIYPFLQRKKLVHISLLNFLKLK